MLIRHFKGYPGCEFQVREALAEAIGEQKAEFFFDRVRISPKIQRKMYIF